MFWKILLHIWAYAKFFEEYLIYYPKAIAWIAAYNSGSKVPIGPPPPPPPLP